MPSDESNVSERGFNAMDPKQQKDIASTKGKTAKGKAAAHELTSKKNRKDELSSSNEKGTQDGERRGHEDWGGYKGY